MLHSIAVKDYMLTNLVTVFPEMDVMDAIHLMLQNRVSGVPVVDKLGNIVGTLSERDCMKVALNASYHEEKGGRVSQFMSRGAVTIDADSSLVEAAEMFYEKPYRFYPVVENTRLVGQLRRSDVLKALEILW